MPMFEVSVGMPDPRARIRRPFRCQFVLMALGEYAYGDHVRDDEAFIRRCYRVHALRRSPDLEL